MKEWVTCFRVKNIRTIETENPEIVSCLEREFAYEGAIPALIDTEKELFCVTIVRKETTIPELIAIFAKHGIVASLVEK